MQSDFQKMEENLQAMSDAAIRKAFEGAADFVVRPIQADGQTVYCYFIDGLVMSTMVSDFVIRPILMGQPIVNAVTKPVPDLDTLILLLVNGFSVLRFPDKVIACETRTGDKRNPSPPTVENTVKGAKDAFTETIRTNTSLIRRHLRSPKLRLKESQVGRRSLTNVSVVYLEDLTDPELVQQVINRMDEIDIDGLISPAAVEEYLTGSRKTAFPMTQFTERADQFCRALLAGRVGVLVDGLPLGYLLPVDLGMLMESPEDRGTDYVSATFVRVLRYVALVVSLLLPALYVAISTFHQEMIPTQLLEAIIESKREVPFPTVLEVLGLLIAFELLQEAGIHLPQSIGQTVSIIGGLVVGTAAVEARLISPAALIVVAVAGVCGFTLPGRDFSDALRIWRIVLTLCAALVGLFGVTAGVLALLIHLSALESCGRPYLAPFSSARLGGALLRRRLVQDKFRDRTLRPQDLRNQK